MMHQGELFTARSSRRQDVDGFPHRMAMPAIRRTSIVPSQIDRHPLRRWWRRVRFGATATTSPSHDTHGVAPGWRRQARRRRIGLALLILVQTALAAWLLGHTFPYSGLSALEAATLGVFAVLWVWISLGFWTAVAGFVVTWTNATRVVRDTATGDDGRPLRSRTAILVPIYNEDVRRVFAGVEATYRSLAATGYLDAFDFYVLSDTRDGATRHAEARAWDDTCRAVDGFGRLFYRHRRNNIKRKSGNIADFLRRWGRNYDYMIVFDADTVMAGSSLVRLVRLMEERPRAGIIQTIPAMVNRETLFGRVQQFASRAYGPMLAAGLRYWQLGESYYWGHNAILRCEAFIRHCGLPRLPGQPPLGGEILSHDFVEAALMGRGGWEVWIECGVSGSYEETPPTLLDDLKRDRRWCQGNLQHVRLLFVDGIRFGHRAIMAMGVVAYVSALFWATFIVLSTVVVVEKWFSLPPYFASGPSLFPLWPQWRPELAVALLGTTAVLLLLPKILSVFVIARARQAVLFGSLAHLWASVALEIVFSTLLAPIRMWFHSKFVLFTLTGRQITWNAQCRDDNETRWSDAIREHGPAAGVALAGMLGLGALSWSLIWWVLPLVAALLLAGPLSVYSSRASIGRAVRRWGLFVTPEETDPPDVIRSLHDALERRSTKRARLEGTRRVDSSRVPRTDRAAA